MEGLGRLLEFFLEGLDSVFGLDDVVLRIGGVFGRIYFEVGLLFFNRSSFSATKLVNPAVMVSISACLASVRHEVVAGDIRNIDPNATRAAEAASVSEILASKASI